MARPRTPTSLLDARNSFKKHPERKRDGEPVSKNPLGAPPGRLSEVEREAWGEIVNYAPMGVLTEADRNTVEITSMLLAESWEDFAKMNTTRISMLISNLGRFGMNPSDRAKLSIPKAPDANPFDSLD